MCGEERGGGRLAWRDENMRRSHGEGQESRQREGGKVCNKVSGRKEER